MRIPRYLVACALIAGCASASSEQAPPRPVKEFVSGGARLRGGGMRMDVQVGRTFVQRPTSNGQQTATAHAVVTP